MTMVVCAACSSEPAAEQAPIVDSGVAVDDTATVDAAVVMDTAAADDSAADTMGADAAVGADTAMGSDATTPASAPIGWASTAGYGVATTTGGGAATPIVVKTLTELNAAAAGTAAKVVHVSGEIVGKIAIGSNKTIVGLTGAKLRGTIVLNGSANVILRNLTIVGYNCSDSMDCQAGADAIAVYGGAHHLWFDHLDVSDGSDGNLDVTKASDLVTVSWTKFHYSSVRAGGHQFSNLIGADDADKTDAGKLRVTFDHVWWADRVFERMPRVRFGRVHVFNSLYTSTGNSYCVGGGVDANVLLENNVFAGVDDPIRVSSISNAATIVVSKGNVYDKTTGTTADKGGPAFTPPYPYTLDAAALVRASVTASAGPK